MGVFARHDPKDWSAPAGDVAETKMNAVIRILDLSGARTPYDPITNTGGVIEPVTIWEGICRIQHIYTARGANIDGDSTRNPTGQRTVLFQLPLREYSGRIEPGWQIRVIDPGKDQSLTEYLFYIKSAVNSSWAAARTIAAAADAEAKPGWV